VLLVIAAEQEEDLGLESIALPVAVEIGQERIFLEDLEQQVGLKSRRQQAGQCCLSHSDDTFYGNVHGSPFCAILLKDTTG